MAQVDKVGALSRPVLLWAAPCRHSRSTTTRCSFPSMKRRARLKRYLSRHTDTHRSRNSDQLDSLLVSETLSIHVIVWSAAGGICLADHTLCFVQRRKEREQQRQETLDFDRPSVVPVRQSNIISFVSSDASCFKSLARSTAATDVRIKKCSCVVWSVLVGRCHSYRRKGQVYGSTRVPS